MVRPNPAGELDAVALETALLETWKNEQTFQQSIDSNRTGAPFIFLEGPPTANGKPGIHHVVARAYKDLVCRWKTMEGFLVERKGGWDTHGLPVEIEVQKRLDLMSNEAIEEFGMQAFNDACRESVWTYESAWREMTERMAYWVDLDNPYVTSRCTTIMSSHVGGLSNKCSTKIYSIEVTRFCHIVRKPEHPIQVTRWHWATKKSRSRRSM